MVRRIPVLACHVRIGKSSLALDSPSRPSGYVIRAASMTDPLPSHTAAVDPGTYIHSLITELHPICRSITGPGVTETLTRLQQEIPLTIHEVASGTPVLDWTVPREWTVEEAWIRNANGEKIVDFKKHNLHVVNYSSPVDITLPLAELRKHLFSLPEKPTAIPYRTSYYDDSWGFCLSHEALEKLEDEDYHAHISGSLAPGFLRYGEVIIPGRVEQEILITTHVCHPSMANDNLSGIGVATLLARSLAGTTPHFTHRFLFIPGTIGSITWLERHRHSMPDIRHGLVLTGVGDAGAPTYKRSRRSDAGIDRAMEYILRHHRPSYQIRDFSPFGYDERQFCSPGFDLPVGCLMRTPHGEYPEYHTSLDDLDFVKAESLADSYQLCLLVLGLLEKNRTYRNLAPHGEPQLGRRGLYKAMGQQTADRQALQLSMLWVLNQSDGGHDLLDIAMRSGIAFDTIAPAAEMLHSHGLLETIA
jgi:aminopeptidase-like protein